ncbi:MAG: rod shape-determining protein MreC [Firmicutes bacterium]|nr:rod shape-determining protein MreC [Bacillota bacterium]
MLEQLLRWKILLGIVLIIVLIGTIHYTSLTRPKISFLEGAWRDALAPLQLVLSRAQRFFRQATSVFRNIGDLQRRNKELETLVFDLQQKVFSLQNHKRENEWLREALDFVSDMPHELLVAEVIGRSPSNWESTITINKGHKHGVASGMAVITNAGIVGTVINSSLYTSIVLLATDSQSATGGLVQSSGDLVLIEGDPSNAGMMIATPLGRDTEVEEGDLIVTSGLSRIYPKNISVGEVIAVEPREYELSFAALVRPSVNFSRLEYVLVVLPDG